MPNSCVKKRRDEKEINRRICSPEPTYRQARNDGRVQGTEQRWSLGIGMG